jgi:hypothetical protein
MNKATTTALGLLAGFIGGAMSHYLFVPMTVQAQAQSPTQIRAREFVLVDENGTARGVFGFQSDGNPALQVRYGNARGDVVSPRWNGVFLQRNVVPDLKLATTPKSDLPTSSK